MEEARASTETLSGFEAQVKGLVIMNVTVLAQQVTVLIYDNCNTKVILHSFMRNCLKHLNIRKTLRFYQSLELIV